MGNYELGLQKKSFSLFYNGGEIWTEHLDSMYEKRELVLEKFHKDMETVKKPSTSSFVVVNFDETLVDEELLLHILGELSNMEKGLRKLALVGLDRNMKKVVKKQTLACPVKCIDDFEKAKAWLI